LNQTSAGVDCSTCLLYYDGLVETVKCMYIVSRFSSVLFILHKYCQLCFFCLWAY